MDLKYIPKEKHNKYQQKYKQEILKMVSINQNLLSKLFNEEFKLDPPSNENLNTYFIKIHDSFKGKKIDFCLIIRENKEKKIDIQAMMKQNLYENIHNYLNELKIYIQKEVLDQIFYYG